MFRKSVAHWMVGMGVVALTLAATSAQANIISLTANQVATPVSTFTLSFSGQPLPSSYISNTHFQMDVDGAVAPSGLARFNSYYQNVDPLTLPDGQGGYVNTGNLTVQIVPGSSGVSSFNPATGEFTTTETYQIDYTGDLTSIGLGNGGSVFFPSTSTGVITFNPIDPTQGTISQHWSGRYDPLGLDYTCVVNTAFPEPAALSLLGLAGLAIIRRRR